MKKIILVLMLTQFSLTLYAENPQICEVKIQKKDFESTSMNIKYKVVRGFK
jgi:hypothetical protein